MIYEGILISVETVRMAIAKHYVYDACTVAYWLGYRNVDSGHGAYRPVLRILNRLHKQGEISKAYFSNNVSVFYKREDWK